MRNMFGHVASTRGIASESGIGIIEYLMIVGLIAVTTLSMVTLLGKNLTTMLHYINVHIGVFHF